MTPIIKKQTAENGKIVGKRVKLSCKCGYKFNTSILTKPQPLGAFVKNETMSTKDRRFDELQTHIQKVMDGKESSIQLLEDTLSEKSNLPKQMRFPRKLERVCLKCLNPVVSIGNKVPVILVVGNETVLINDTSIDMDIETHKHGELIKLPSGSKKTIPFILSMYILPTNINIEYTNS